MYTMIDDKKLMDKKKRILLKAIGKVVFEQRKTLNKGINKFSFEYDIGNGLLSRLEKGSSDVKITTMWKLANAFNISVSDLMTIVEKKLPQNFNFYDD